MTDQAVKAIILKGNKVLILKQVVEDKTFFGLPGGRINTDNHKDELIREVKEETNLDVKVKDYVADWSFTRKNQSTTTCKIYICTPTNDDLSNDNSEDYENIEKFLWLTSKDLQEERFKMDDTLKHIILKAMTA